MRRHLESLVRNVDKRSRGKWTIFQEREILPGEKSHNFIKILKQIVYHGFNKPVHTCSMLFYDSLLL